MISRFFIDRPIFASVLSIVITLAGGIALFTLPVAQYPQISPPTVQVDCNYPGASAQVVSESVATPIEQQVNGVENMLYMSSQCTNDGSYNLTVTFKHGVNLNMAQVLVQNRVSLALPLLPDVLKQTGVTTRKKAPDILLAMALNSPDGTYDQLYLSNYALLHVKDELARLPGISDVTMLGQRDYSMRIWVDPDQLASRSMTADDVVAAIREQNMQVATGQIGQEPAPLGQQIQVPLSTLGRLQGVEQFEKIIIKSTPEGRIVRLRDVARVELNAKSQDLNCRVNGRPSVSLAIFQLPDANALDTAVIVKAKMEVLKKDFPPGVNYEIRYDTTPFIQESINKVFQTLQEAILLVAVVVLLFLQNWRSAVIPLIAVPVAIIGTFAVMAAFGFSLNNLTLFGLVLAIGIVVDDAIVVVEAVEHHIEHGMSPRDATIRAMDEVSGPVIAIGLVLSAVFVPCAFISGIVGQFFRQFALTIATSTLISAFNSLTLSPALAALLLRPRGEKRADPLPRLFFVALGAFLGFTELAAVVAREGRLTEVQAQVAGAALGALAGWLLSPVLNWLLAGLFRLFNRGFERATGLYTRLVSMLLRVGALVLVVYGGLLYMTYWGFNHTPTGFIPSQDMGYLLVNVQLPDAASLQRTQAVMNTLERIAHETPGVKHTQAMAGQSLLLSANGSNFGSMFMILDKYANRPDPVFDRVFRWLGDYMNTPEPSFPEVTARLKRLDLEGRARRALGKGWEKKPALSGDAIANTLRKRFSDEVPEAMMTVLGPPPVRGVGRAGGFKLLVEDRGDFGSKSLQEQAEHLTSVAVDYPPGQPKSLVGMTSVFRANVPQLYADVNRTECLKKEVELQALFDTLRVFLGSIYVNDINMFGRTWQVIIQADAKFRDDLSQIHRLRVRNSEGVMVPLGALMDIKEVTGPLVLTRYNMYPAAPINGSAAPGVSSGTAIEIMEALAARELPENMAIEWTELAYLEIQAGNTAIIVFGFAVVMVFLVLAAQYESWSLPLAIILVVPMCLLSALGGVRATFSDINIFTQIGFVVLVGLASKNAILIVEFAKMRRDEGESRRQATLDACRLRLRPIVMTSLAFILGVVPLITSQGAGAEMRRTLGMTVFSGMLGVTLFGVVLTPVFYFVIDWLGGTRFFSSRIVRRVASIPLAVLSLGFLRRRLARPVPVAKPEPSADPLGELVEHK